MMLIEADGGSTITYILSGLVVGYVLYKFVIARKQMNRPPSENVLILNDSNFESSIRSGVSLVDFWAAWCGPCKVQGPIVDDVADSLGDRAKVCKVDIDENQHIAKKLGIRNIPTLLIFKDGKPVEKLVGVKTKGMLLKAVEAQLN